jgi:ABC-type multidrug transport system fused ATPase/permease subunit
MHRVTSDTKIFETETASLFRDVPGEPVIVVGVSSMMVMLNAGLALAVIVFLLVAAAVTSYLGHPLPGIPAQRLAAQLSARFQETIAGIRTVQSFKNESHELRGLAEQNRKILNLELREGKIYAVMEPLGELLEFLGLVLLARWAMRRRIIGAAGEPAGNRSRRSGVRTRSHHAQISERTRDDRR